MDVGSITTGFMCVVRRGISNFFGGLVSSDLGYAVGVARTSYVLPQTARGTKRSMQHSSVSAVATAAAGKRGNGESNGLEKKLREEKDERLRLMLKSGGLGTAEETRQRDYRCTDGSSSDASFATRRRAYGETRAVPLDRVFARLWEVHRSRLVGRCIIINEPR
ncbi:hypothetical protein BHM03_00013570 [Ensete ventricosum]|nr:hypothetical protein BHM03_00013570 [Ensete ventricosum]